MPSEASASPPESPDWRRILAALLNADARPILAGTVISASAPVPAARRDRALQQLQALGLIERDAAGEPRPSDVPLRAALSGAQAPRARGPERFLDRHGRIDRYPSGFAERVALLEFVLAKAVPLGAVLDERTLGAALSPFTNDVAALRRYLVDHELLERTPTGSEYARVAPPEAPAGA